jgi:hypothetical protein
MSVLVERKQKRKKELHGKSSINLICFNADDEDVVSCWDVRDAVRRRAKISKAASRGGGKAMQKTASSCSPFAPSSSSFRFGPPESTVTPA